MSTRVDVKDLIGRDFEAEPALLDGEQIQAVHDADGLEVVIVTDAGSYWFARYAWVAIEEG